MKKILIIVFSFILWFEPHSQTITIGTGTAINGITTPSPVNINRKRNISHTVYTVAEMNAAGAVAGDIKKMGYFVTNIPIYDIPGYTIQMKHTNNGNAGGNLNGGYSTVKNAFTYSPGQGDWDIIDFDTPFSWNGTQNIVVKICWSAVTPNRDPSGQLRIFNSNRGYKSRTDNNGGSLCNSTPNSRQNVKPQIRFVFESETVWTGAISTNWFTNSNWSANVPAVSMDAKIPTGTPNHPILTGVAECNSLILEGTMTLSVSGVLNVYQNFTNTGTYIDLGGQTVITGVGPNIVNNSGSLTISNLTFNSDNGGIITGSNITISTELQVYKSTLNTNDLITIESTATSTARISELITDCFYTLNMQDSWGDGWNGGTLTILEDGIAIGTYQAYAASTSITLSLANGANIQLQYTAGQYENENTYQLLNPLGIQIFGDGTTPSTGIVFTTTPSCAFTPPIIGDIHMQRHIDAGETYWRFFSSAVQGATIGDYEGDFVTAGYVGSLFPNFGWTSIYNYDETQGSGLGYTPVSSTAQAMNPGEGFMVWSGDTITGTQPFDVDISGVANQGNIIMPVTYTNTGNPNEDGWNLIGNPYPSTIDWTSPSWIKNNIASAIQILNPDTKQYATYVNGASTLGGSQFIPSQQAFWVYANGTGANLTATEGVKSAVDQAFFKSGTISPGVNISVSGFGMTDECVIRHVTGAVDAFDSEFDAHKIWANAGPYPHISLINTTNEDLAVHSFDQQYQEFEVPIRTVVYQNGFYDLTFDNLSELDVPCLKLEDTYTGLFYVIEEDQPINFELSDTTLFPRFILHIGRHYETMTKSVLCYGDSNGEILIELEENTAIDYTVNSNSTLVSATSNGNPLLLIGLTSGTYIINVPNLQNMCDNTNFMVVVSSPAPMSATVIIGNETLGNDGSLQLNVNGGTLPYVYNWNNGAATANQTNLTEGTYSVVATDANGCIFESEYHVNSVLSFDENESEIQSLKIIYSQLSHELSISGLSIVTDENIFIYDLSGKLVDQHILPAASTTTTVELRTNLSKGIYIVKLNGTSQKIVY